MLEWNGYAMRRGRCRSLTGRIGHVDCYRGISTHASLPETVVGLRLFFGINVRLENEDTTTRWPPSSLILFLKGWSGSIPYCAHRPSTFQSCAVCEHAIYAPSKLARNLFRDGG